jgi:hypothetical protein
LTYTVDSGTPSADFSLAIDSDTGLATMTYGDTEIGISGTYTVTVNTTEPSLTNSVTYY